MTDEDGEGREWYACQRRDAVFEKLLSYVLLDIDDEEKEKTVARNLCVSMGSASLDSVGKIDGLPDLLNTC